ncbi:hypothetical protein L1871_00660 [Aeromonas caviae]|uniref:hypothetical protein n=7 Tax=Aeromonas caviae TaxID=648 RepID=UPI001F30AE0F|nr:hypothetical protein [Aeromonas caviae]UJQ37091.1 hypothetical protein L1871_00660 [Aeromonas caviae]
MKKNVLSMAVACVLSGVMLTACGGGGDDNGGGSNGGNNGGGTDTGSKPLHTAVFLDSVVGGLDYRCNDYTGVTNAKGEFLFDDGDTCEFALGNQRLGAVTLKAGNSLVTPYTLAGDDKEKAIRIAALLQTLDSDSNPENGITLDKAQVAQLGIVELGSDDAFNTSLVEALKTAGLTKAVVSLAAAKAHLSATLAGVNGRSVAVDKVLSDLQALTDLKTLDVESKFKEYKETLQAETSDSGKVDREIVLAMLTLLEVTNDPIISQRFELQPTSQLGQGYETSLAKILDIIINPGKAMAFAIKTQPESTVDIATLMGKYAAELDKVSSNLANISDPDYAATYENGDASFTINFDTVKELRASALALASAMNVIASYQYGSASLWQAHSDEQVTFDTFAKTYKYTQEQSQTEFTFGRETINAEYLQANIRPASLLEDKNFFVQVPGYAALLTKAKQQLQESLDIAATLQTLGDTLVEQKSFIEKLRKHLMGDPSVPTIEMHDNVHIDDEGEWLGRDIEAKYMVNINQFFALGLDRSAVDINVTEYCKYRGKTAGEYDESMSKALDMAMCRVSESEVKNINQQSEEFGAFLPFYFLDHESLQNAETGDWEGYVYHFAQGIPMNWFSDIRAKSDTSFGKVFVSCKARLDGSEEWQEKPCDWLFSNSLSENSWK